MGNTSGTAEPALFASPGDRASREMAVFIGGTRRARGLRWMRVWIRGVPLDMRKTYRCCSSASFGRRSAAEGTFSDHLSRIYFCPPKGLWLVEDGLRQDDALRRLPRARLPGRPQVARPDRD